MAEVRKQRARAVTVMSNIVQGSSSRESNKAKPGSPWDPVTALMALALAFREKDRGK